MLVARRVQIQKITGGPCNGGYSYLLWKLTLKTPDGGEVEFRDDLYDGAPLPATGCGSSSASRGVRWHATDGSGMIFVNDVDNGVANYNTSGVVITRDGTRYRFGGSLCTSITDRNGNKITIQYETQPTRVSYTDQLGRVTTIKQNVPDPDNPSITLAILVTFPGYQGTPRYYKIKRGIMNANYRSDSIPTLPVITGDWDPLSRGYGWPATATRLFVKSYGLYAYQIDDLNVLTELVLPDTRSLKFRYNSFGEVAEVILPTGGKIQYDYSYVSVLPSGNSPGWQTGTQGTGEGILTDVKQVDRAVVESRTYPDGTTLEGKWNYIYGPQLVNGVNQPCTQVQARTSSETLLIDQRHFFLPAQQYTEAPGTSNHDGTHYAIWSTGVEWRTEARDTTGNILSATEQDWTQRAQVSWPTYVQEQPVNDNRVNQTRKYLDTGMMAKTETFYDQYNNPTQIKEYDYDGTLKRRTVTSYISTLNGYNYQTDDSIHLLGLPDTTSVFIGAQTNPVAQSVNEYDVYTDDGNHYLLTDYTSISQHDSSYGVSKTTRGNLTSVGQWLNTTNSFIYTYSRFDTLGNVVSTKDANAKVTTVSFADDFGLGQNPGTPTQNPATPTYAFPTLITSPPPLPGAPVHTARSQYDYSSGLLTGFRDRNDVVTQTIYNDPFNRPTQVKSALGVAGVETHLSTYYAPATAFGITLAKNDILTVNDLDAVDDASIRSWTVTDGFGRTSEAWTRDPEGDVKVITLYDALGRAKQVSNPFRPATENAVYTTTSYDLAGRVTSLTTPDNAVVSTSYSANTVTVTDQADKKRKSVTDGLGRLIEVYEDPNGPNNPNGLNYQTTYTYDVLDNLVKVTQGIQQRFFMYDSLKRLIRARNPEQSTHAGLALTDPLTQNTQWSTGYAYDANGNLIEKTDARGVVSTYAYDAFNRNTTINYSDTAINPDVSRSYDGATKGKGRLWASYAGGTETNGDNVEKTVVVDYDALGRPFLLRRSFKFNGAWNPNWVYDVSRTYNRTGGVKSQTYPSGHLVTYNYDSAGRLADKDSQNLAFTGNLGDGVLRTYSRGISYVSSGQLKQEQFGTNTPVYHNLHYNVRRQLCDVRASNSNDEWGGELGALVNYYSTPRVHCGSGGDNNGNVLMSQTIINSVYFEDRYTYDALNRLTGMTEYLNGVGSPTGSQQYNYDLWGNRNITPSSPAIGFNTSFDKEDATNRLYAPGDLALADELRRIRYDKTGNQIKDTFTGYGTATFDADNHIISIQDFTGGSSNYTYDADGNRTRRKTNNQETWQIYGMDDELLAEYAANAVAATPQKEYGYRSGQLLVTAEPAPIVATNVALASSGATATVSSTWVNPPYSYLPSSVNNGDHRGLNAGNNSNWTSNGTTLPQWVEVAFNTSKTINEIDVFSLQDNYANPIEPTEATTFSLYGLTAFQVQYWTGTVWVTVPGGSVSGNNKVWKKITFAPIPTTKIRVLISATSDGWSRIVEVEAWTPARDNLNWLVTDHLGTPRIIIDKTGSLSNVKRHDYLPFGEELMSGIGSRGPSLGYGTGDGVRPQFTSKERDNETGLDYFGARYYSSTQGRFTSPDPFSIIQMRQSAPNDAKTHSAFMQFIGDPRRWNRFAYAINSPLVFTDKTGLDIMIIENGATKGNPMGHTAIAITGRGVYSMGNAEKTDRHRDNKNNIVGGGVENYIDREGPRRNTTITIIKTTLEQDAAVEKSMVEQARDKPKLESGIKITVADNCSTRVNEALDAAGINSAVGPPTANTPGSAGFRAIGSGQEYQIIQVPKGSNYDSLSDADKTKIREFEPIEDRKMKPEKP